MTIDEILQQIEAILVSHKKALDVLASAVQLLMDEKQREINAHHNELMYHAEGHQTRPF